MAEASSKPVVLVTGGSGLLGSRLVRRLRSRYQVVSLDLVGDPTSPEDVEFVCIDITSDDSVRRAVDRVRSVYGPRVASLVHLIAHYDFSGEPSPLYDKITVDGTRRLLDATKALDLEQLVFTSTLLVHAPVEPGEVIDEDEPVEPTWPYPESKVRAEEAIRGHDSDFSRVILRLAGAYDEDGSSPPLTNQIRRIHGRAVTSHFYPAGLDRGQPFVHLDDAIDALVRIVDRREDLPEEATFLVGEPLTLGFGEVQDLIGEALFGKRWRTFYVPPSLARPGAWLLEHNPWVSDPFMRTWAVERASDHYELDISRARQMLGWDPRHWLADVVPLMVERLLEDPDGWYERNGLEHPRRARAR